MAKRSYFDQILRQGSDKSALSERESLLFAVTQLPR